MLLLLQGSTNFFFLMSVPVKGLREERLSKREWHAETEETQTLARTDLSAKQTERLLFCYWREVPQDSSGKPKGNKPEKSSHYFDKSQKHCPSHKYQLLAKHIHIRASVLLTNTSSCPQREIRSTLCRQILLYLSLFSRNKHVNKGIYDKIFTFHKIHQRYIYK